MSLLFIDGFDHYSTNDITRKWDEREGSSWWDVLGTSGRRGGGAIGFWQPSSPRYAYVGKNIEANSTIIVGCAMQFTTTPSNENSFRIQFYDDSTLQCYMEVYYYYGSSSPNYYIWMKDDAGNVIEEYSDTIPSIMGTWIYYEVSVTIGASGVYEVKANGESVLSGTGDLQASANSTANKVRAYYYQPANYSNYNEYTCLVDDLYILNGAGTSNNDFLGDCKIECIYPEADYGTQDFTPSTGTAHFELVDETDPDDDSTYVYANLTDLKDRFTFGDDIESDGQIFGVQHNMLARKLTVGLALGLKALVNRGGTDYVLTQKFPESSYKFLTPIWEEDPYTTSQWLKANVNNIIAGFKMGTSS